jgi:hypothetical protein
VFDSFLFDTTLWDQAAAAGRRLFAYASDHLSTSITEVMGDHTVKDWELSNRLKQGIVVSDQQIDEKVSDHSEVDLELFDS